MKKHNIILWFAGACILLSLLLLLTKCENNHPKTVVQSYLIDISEKGNVLIPDQNQVKTTFPFEENKFSGGVFRLKIINSTHYSEIHELKLKKAQALTSNEITRVHEIKRFKKDIGELLSSIERQKQGSAYSLILEPFIKELNYLKDIEAETKRLYCYSDLREYSPKKGSLNLYDTETIEMLQLDPQKIKERIKAYPKMPNDLKGIEIHFVYKSSDYDSIQIFEQMAKILSYILEEKGATVYIHSQY